MNKSKNARQDFYKVLAFLKKKAPIYLGSVVLNNIITSICYNIVLAIILQIVLDSIQLKEVTYLYRAFWIAGISFGFAFLFGPVFMKIKNQTVRSTMSEIRRTVFHRIQNCSVDSYEKSQRGDLLVKLTKDVEVIEGIYIELIPNLCFAIVHGCIATGIMIYYNVILGGFSILVGLLSVFVNFLISKKIKKFSEKRQALHSQVSQELMDSIEGVIDIKMTTSERYFCRKFQTHTNGLRENEFGNGKAMTLLKSANKLFENINTILVMALGLYFVLKGMTTVGIVVAIIQLQGNASYLFSNLSSFIGGVANALPSARRISEIFELEEEKTVLEQQEERISKFSDLELQGISFGYREGSMVIDHLDLCVKAGEAICIVGGSGNGKSTLNKLLLGFYRPNIGQYRLNGSDTQQMTAEQIRSQIAYLDQSCYLFHTTVEENIRMGNLHASKEEVIQACKKAGAHEFIKNLPNGYQTVIKEGSDNISGGQRQRIALARLFISDKPIYLLDEATANLDKKTEKIVYDALYSMKGEKTMILISHRKQLMQMADSIYRLENGRLEKEQQERIYDHEKYSINASI